MGLTILPPHVNSSDKLFTVVDGQIVYGLQGVKNIGGGAVEEILRARAAGGKFESFMDFLGRVDLRAVNKRLFETGIQCGVFDGLGANRATLFHNLDKAIEWAAKEKEEKASGQGGLFDGDDSASPPFAMVVFPEWDQKELLNFEKVNLGTYVSGHPLDAQRELWKQTVSVNLGAPKKTDEDKKDQLMGIISGIRIQFTKKGLKMARAVLEDFNGSIDLVIFPKTFAKVEPWLTEEAVLGFTGKVEINDEGPKFLVDDILHPEGLAQVRSLTVHVRLKPKDWQEPEIVRIRDSFLDHQGSSPLVLHLSNGAKTATIRCPNQLRVASSQDVLDKLGTHSWVEAVWRE